MKFLAWMLILCVSMSAYAQDISKEITEATRTSTYKDAAKLFGEGKYQSTTEELIAIEANETNKSKLGFISYWKGICYNRLQEYGEAIKSFKTALSYNYAPQDLHYEYGQALFAAEKLTEARLQFRESVKRKFKRGVSLYYIGYISKEMGERKKAFTFFKSIDKLPANEATEVKQAAEMQVGDIYLEQVEKHPDAFRSVEEIVIPQYEKAMAVDQTSALAPQIREKISSLQRKYDLVLFQLRNGRPALIPPYYLRAAQEFGFDTNVTFAPADTTISSSDQASTYSKTDVMGRYTFYHRDYFSIAPEFRFANTYYFKRIPEVYRNDNYFLAPALRTAYEHTLWKKPAAFLADYDYNESRRDVNAKKKLEFSSRSHSFMLGEKFNYFSLGESILRLRYRMLDSYSNTQDSKTISLVYEQIMIFKVNTFLLYASYDRMRVEDSTFDTNAFTVRGDLIMGRVRDWFTPMVGLTLTSTDPINNQSARGRELLFNPSVRLARTFKKNWRANVKYEYMKNNSKDTQNFAYKKSIYAFELEYLF